MLFSTHSLQEEKAGLRGLCFAIVLCSKHSRVCLSFMVVIDDGPAFGACGVEWRTLKFPQWTPTQLFLLLETPAKGNLQRRSEKEGLEIVRL